MITGYNHNIKHNDRVYHIQTEDSGLQHPHIITHLFVGGNIIHSLKRSYAHLLEEKLHEDEEAFEKVIREMMKEQHKQMLKQLKAGKHDHVGDKKSAGALLTPGLLSLGEKATGEPAETPSTPPPLAPEPVEALEVEEPPPLPEPPAPPLPLEPPPPKPADELSQTLSDAEESTVDTASKGKAKRRSRLGRARPAFQAPPPQPVAPPINASASDTPVDLPASRVDEGAATILDIKAFGHDYPAPPPKTPAPVQPPALDGGRRSLRRRGAGKGRRPELEFKGSDGLMSGSPTPIETPAFVTSPPKDVREAARTWLATEPVATIPARPATPWPAELKARQSDTNRPIQRSYSSRESSSHIREHVVRYLKKDEHT